MKLFDPHTAYLTDCTKRCGQNYAFNVASSTFLLAFLLALMFACK